MLDGLFSTLAEVDKTVTNLERQVYQKKKPSTTKTKKQPIFNDSEKLALGLYPKDEGYKMSLISRILGKR